jgi:hypothetical protein
LRWAVDIPDELREHKPSRDDVLRKRPALCPTCGICVEYDELRAVRLIDGWPISVAPCARAYEVADCHRFQERGPDIALRQALGATT